MKKISLFLITYLTFFSTHLVFATEADDVLGLWKTVPSELGYSHIKIYKNNGQYQGEIVFLSQPNYSEKEANDLNGLVQAGEPRRDLSNPDKGKRQDSVMGMQLVSGFKFKGKQWKGGKVYDPESGKTYKAKMWLNKDGTLGLRGYVGISAFGRSTKWTAVAENIETPTE